MKIVCAQSVMLAKEIFSELGEVTMIPDQLISPDHLKTADCLIIRSKTKVNEKLLTGTSIKFVGTATAGIDHLNLNVLNQKGITWCNAPGANCQSVAQYVVSVLCLLANQYKFNLFSKTLGIIGAGHVGTALASIATALGLRVLLNDPLLQLTTLNACYLPLSTVLENADIISLHVPLTHDGNYPTYQLVNDTFLTSLKPGALLINTSRGDVINERSLLTQLAKQKMGPVVLDVWPNEPALNHALLKKAAIATPHIAGYSMDGRIKGSLNIYQQLCTWLGMNPTKSIEQLCPQARQRVINLHVINQDLTQTLCDIIAQVYNPYTDHAALLRTLTMQVEAGSEYFKQLRHTYPPRWEFAHFPIHLHFQSAQLMEKLTGLGFKVTSI